MNTGRLPPPCGEGWGGGCQINERFGDHLLHTIRIGHDVVVPKPQNAETATAEEVVARCIVAQSQIGRMGFAIDLDDQGRLVASEIDIAGAKQDLPAEVVTLSTKRMEQRPHAPLGLGRIAAQFAGEFSAHWGTFGNPERATHPTLDPSPSRGGRRLGGRRTIPKAAVQ